MHTQPTQSAIARHLGNFQWEGVETLAYKENDSPFKAITRQVLFESPDLLCQLRYFEVQPGGYSTLERHEHVHAVLILRGSGRVLVGQETRPIHHLDLVYIPPMTWHQFHADQGEVLGFLCLVNVDRDRPQLPTAADLAELSADQGKDRD